MIYQPKLKKIMTCLRCGGIITKKAITKEISGDEENCYRCNNYAKCTYSRVPCEDLDKVIENELEKINKHFLSTYENNLTNKYTLSELYQKRLEVIKAIFYISKKERKVLKDKIKDIDKLEPLLEKEFSRKYGESKLKELEFKEDEIKQIMNVAIKPFGDGPIIKDLDYDNEYTGIEKQIYWAEWEAKYNEKEFKYINILKYTNIQLNLKDRYGIIKFIKPPIKFNLSEFIRKHIEECNMKPKYLFSILPADEKLIPDIDIKFSWVLKRGRPSKKQKEIIK